MRQNPIYRQSLLKTLTLALFILASVLPASVLANESGKSPTFDGTTTLQTILTSSHRSLANSDRDKYRHPAETLKFFGLSPNMTVVELWPGSGWYTEILAPFLASKGQLIVTNSASNSKSTLAFQQKLAANPEVFGKVKVVPINPPNELTLAPDNSVDLVVTFRNIHNWVSAGYAEQVYAAAYKALKPGGILGVEEHRAKPGISLQESIKTGYMSEDEVITAVEKVGFKLVGKSEINANPKDTKDYPGGVWTLPPTLSQGQKDRERFVTIGESDRMTLKFVKPKAP
ncbi:class I SAM-dependent methyltransferase [Nostoc sp. TCL240-02]|uniref:class I SAM-dependent methyltransferase n=1 Tax=Nostoc sp. TCL240-02 TaxID=2572090 RepID=UPI00157F949E|nr:methyltransferase domain-containing protein [Nostoc sp. TCL240-02]QKQ74893.1 class I SAM-dependent methyltransferase [Nostoc sp. TCL240-02]